MDKEVRSIYLYLLSTRYTDVDVITRVDKRDRYFGVFTAATDYISQYVRQAK